MPKPKKKRNKKYNPKRYINMMLNAENTLMRKDPLLVEQVMRNWDEMLDELEEYGTLTTVGDNDTPVCFDYAKGEMYELVPAARGFLQFIKLWEDRHPEAPKHGLATLHALIGQIDGKIPVAMSTIKKSRDVVNRIRETVRNMTKGEAKDLVTTVQIKQELEHDAFEQNV